MRGTIKVNEQNKVFYLVIINIIRLEAKGMLTVFYLKELKQHICTGNIKKFHDRLDEKIFCRVHDSHVINLNEMECFDKVSSNAIMKDESIVPVSERKRAKFLKCLDEE